MSAPFRSTQRAPRACTACYKAKVKCDKTIPCTRCVARGTARDCRREVVLVHGQVRDSALNSSRLGWDDLLHENHRLRAMVANQTGQERRPSQGENPDSTFSSIEKLETQLFAMVDELSTPRTVATLADVMMPSKESSDAILQHAFQWTFWQHFSLIIPEFKAEHERFWTAYSETNSLQEIHPLWLAIFFSVIASELLFMTDAEVAASNLPHLPFQGLLKNWYDTALYFLDRADFMQKPDIRSIQAICILGLVFPNVGDFQRQRALRSLAIRQAQELKLGIDSAHLDEAYIDQQKRRRLWWTLVICEWLPVPYQSPCIHADDFHCDVPDEIDDEELCDPSKFGGKSRLSKSKPRPIQYHIAMIGVAKIYYRIRSLMRLPGWNIDEMAGFIFTADEGLATLISSLPTHLQFDEKSSEASLERDERLPWIPWQRNSITMTLLYYRKAIGRLLHAHWLNGSANVTRTRAICVSSAQGMVNATRAENVDPSKMRHWFSAISVYAATITLRLESDVSNANYSEEINQALEYLQRITPFNSIAGCAIDIINRTATET